MGSDDATVRVFERLGSIETLLTERVGVLESRTAAVEDHLKRMEEFMLIIASKAKDAAAGKGRCANCGAHLISAREPYPGGLCWPCWRDTSAARTLRAQGEMRP